ncbi:MAG: FAD-linked oxidase C-terminal domain-containing protein, partial [Acidimicrobiia bacterium]|nr:FAD-linked oxidase C-terminal domain-containing protein [Acidimicrobiia bacterium]
PRPLGDKTAVMPLVEDLRHLVGREHVLDSGLARHLYSKDAGVFRGSAGMVVLPGSTDEVAGVVKLAGRYRVPIVARGAGTGLAAGAVPVDGGIVLSTTRMNRIEEIDVANRTAWVGPGVINLDLTRATTPMGLHFAPDPSSQAACTVGGNVANNSGGPHCLAEGSTVNHVLAMEVVLADGTVAMVGSEAPDPIGLDLRGILVGSEGTLAIVTRALVKLTPNAPDVRTLLVSFSSVADAAATVSGIIAAGVVPAALEMMDKAMTEAVENWLHAGLPTGAAAILLAEVVGETAAVEAEATLIEQISHTNRAEEVRLARDEEERALLWKGRKSAFGAVAQAAPNYYLHDTVVPRTRLVATMAEVYRIGERHGLTMLNVFHAGDGNLHPLMAFDGRQPGMLEKVQAAAIELVELCVRQGGALSGEHGIGREKRDLMPLMFNEVDLDAQARLKETFDPEGLFNPGKILPAGSRCFDLGGGSLPDGVWV